MCTRISKGLLPLLALAACGDRQGGGEGGGNVLLPCRTGGAQDLQPACLIERSDGPRGRLLTIRHPDGGFRRLRIVSDGRGVISADGGEEAKVQTVGNRMIQVDVGHDSYRLPATIGAGED